MTEIKIPVYGLPEIEASKLGSTVALRQGGDLLNLDIRNLPALITALQTILKG